MRQIRDRAIILKAVPFEDRHRVVTALTAGRLPGMSLWQSVAQLVYPRHVAPAVEALGAFDLSEKIWDRVDRLSGGERQRVGLARALMSPATLWLVDEPLSALDPKRARQAITTLTQRAQARNITLITSYDETTDLKELATRLDELKQSLLELDVALDVKVNENLHDREIRIDNGWTVKIGRGLDFFQKPDSWFSVGANDISLRRCLETKVDIFKAARA